MIFSKGGKPIGLKYKIHQMFKRPYVYYNKIDAFVLGYRNKNTNFDALTNFDAALDNVFKI